MSVINTAAASPTADPELLRRLAQRLEHDLGVVLAAVPPVYRTASALSRWTGVVRPLCHRVMAATAPRSEPLELLDALPGVEGLEMVLSEIAIRSGDMQASVSAVHAVRSYRELIGMLGGSQAKARRNAAILVARERAGGDPALESRRALFGGAAEVADAECDAILLMHVLGPPRAGAQGDPHRTVRQIVAGYIGLKRGPRSLPIVHTHRLPHSAAQPAPVPVAGASVLAEFTTHPLPTVVTRGDPGYECDVFDFASDAAAPAAHRSACSPTNLFLQTGSTIDRSDVGYGLHVVTRVPTRRLVVDLILHQGLGYSGPAWGGVYFTGLRGEVKGEPSARWSDRLDILARPGVFDPGSAAPPTLPDFPPHGPLIDGLIAGTGAPASEFWRFRFTVEYPIWGADHVLRI
ncbi:MAG: hypothetical protein K2Q20_11855, partial [Phycisphaerales bacterium]|nr:hypothetical protein [Phycisphaerales bacterium]